MAWVRAWVPGTGLAVSCVAGIDAASVAVGCLSCAQPFPREYCSDRGKHCLCNLLHDVLCTQVPPCAEC